MPQHRVYQINQAVSKETYQGFLCAPDGSRGGWRRLLEMQPGDIIFHNDHATIRAVSVVEPMNLDDTRIRSRIDRIWQGKVVGACLRYEGHHLSLPDFPVSNFLVCLIRMALTDVAFPYARRFGGYAVEVREEDLASRPDLAKAAVRATTAR
jgi:hypothetical protein